MRHCKLCMLWAGWMLVAGLPPGVAWAQSREFGPDGGGHTKQVWSVAFSPDGKLLGSASDDGTVKLWEFPGGKLKQTLSPDAGEVTSLAFSPNGKSLGAACYKGVVTWDTATWQAAPLKRLEFALGVTYSPDGSILATWQSLSRGVKIWDVKSGKETATFADHKDDVRDVCFAPDGKSLASASKDKTVRLWDLSSKKCIGVLEGHNYPVDRVCFSPDGKQLASAGGRADPKILLWDVVTKRQTAALREEFMPQISGLAFNLDGTTLAAGGTSREVQLWDVAKGKPFARLESKGDGNNPLLGLAFSPDGKSLATGWSDGVIRVWDVPKAK